MQPNLDLLWQISIPNSSAQLTCWERSMSLCVSLTAHSSVERSKFVFALALPYQNLQLSKNSWKTPTPKLQASREPARLTPLEWYWCSILSSFWKAKTKFPLRRSPLTEPTCVSWNSFMFAVFRRAFKNFQAFRSRIGIFDDKRP